MPNLIYYKDSGGVVRGPLVEEEATALLNANFFRPDHVFRSVDSQEAANFMSIDDLRSLNGAETPFGRNGEQKEEKELVRVYKERMDPAAHAHHDEFRHHLKRAKEAIEGIGVVVGEPLRDIATGLEREGELLGAGWSELMWQRAGETPGMQQNRVFHALTELYDAMGHLVDRFNARRREQHPNWTGVQGTRVTAANVPSHERWGTGAAASAVTQEAQLASMAPAHGASIPLKMSGEGEAEKTEKVSNDDEEKLCFACPFGNCKRVFNKMDTLAEHTTSDHYWQGAMYVQCSECFERFDNDRTFENENHKLSCTVGQAVLGANMWDEEETEEEREDRRALEKKLLACPYPGCDFSTKSKGRSIFKHIIKAHGNDERACYKCKCGLKRRAPHTILFHRYSECRGGDIEWFFENPAANKKTGEELP